MSKLDDLMLFVNVVDTNSFSEAARKLGITKSVVSKHIHQLETQLNARLLNRSTRKLSLTEAGSLLYQHCKRIQQDIDTAIQVVSDTQNEPRGKLRINAPLSFGHLHLTSAITDFNKNYPDIEVELLLGSQYSNLIETGFDLAIQIKDLPDSSLAAKKLAVRSTQVCASPAYFKKFGYPQSPEDLKNHNCLIYRTQGQTNDEWRFIINGQDKIIKVQGDFQVNSSLCLAKAAASSAGIAKLPGYMINDEIKEGRLETVLHEYCPRDIGIYMVYPQNRLIAPKVKVFIDFLTRRFANEGYWNN
ncbi:MAG: hypothetical protein A3F17_00170 [Gammaproteobacteria bacterium RIFCSPHIGHO2_12_FULL_41_15]|nr:MAG: hypothetical protein A3F17_00170 [Gammaproteobacteria bacterium RIFCSPHIGHO2_12_FULL_41_15]